MIETQWDLEVMASTGCNTRCVSCSHASPFMEHRLYLPADLERDLNCIKDMLRVKLFFCQGGELLTSPHAMDLLKLIAASGMSKQPGILTNGKLLKKQPDSFWETMSGCKAELRISVYPDLDKSIVPYAAKKCEEYGIVFVPREVNKFFVGFSHHPKGESYYGCIWNRCLTLHHGYFYLCPQSALFPQKYMNLPEAIDGLPLRGLTEDRLR